MGNPAKDEAWRVLKILALAALALAAAAPAETPQPNNSGKLAPLQFRVTTPSGSGLARYYANGSLEGNAQATRALIMVHGVLRDADYYFDTAIKTVHDARAPRTLVIAPQFVEPEDVAGHAVPAATLRWKSDWPGGSPALGPAPIGTYDVFDAMVARLSDRSRFPAMREIIIAGHSAGGQIVQRYAAVGRQAALDRVHFIVANPSSYLYFTNDRPVPQHGCPDYNHWRYGFIGAPPYVRGTPHYFEQQYVRRHVTYLLGTADTNPVEEDLDRTCGGEAQGPYRFARGKNYIAYIRRRHPEGTNQDYAFVRGVPHDNRRMFRSACAIGSMFGRSEASCAAHGKIR